MTSGIVKGGDYWRARHGQGMDPRVRSTVDNRECG